MPHRTQTTATVRCFFAQNITPPSGTRIIRVSKAPSRVNAISTARKTGNASRLTPSFSPKPVSKRVSDVSSWTWRDRSRKNRTRPITSTSPATMKAPFFLIPTLPVVLSGVLRAFIMTQLGCGSKRTTLRAFSIRALIHQIQCSTCRGDGRGNAAHLSVPADSAPLPQLVSGGSTVITGHRLRLAPLGIVVLVTAVTAAAPDRLTSRPRPTGPAVKSVPVGEEIQTSAGQRRRVLLPDGSVVYVNEQTTFKVVARRALKLTAGEVLVEAAPGKERFVIATPKRDVKALGTSFAVRATDEGTSVLVARGKVEVVNPAGGKALMVNAGQR